MSTIQLKLTSRITQDTNHTVTIVNGSGVSSSTAVNNKVSVTSFTATPTSGAQITVATITFSSDGGYYYSSEPSFEIISSKTNSYVVTESLVKDSSNRITSKVFVIKFTGTTNTVAQVISFSHKTEKWLITQKQINAFINSENLYEIKGFNFDESDVLSSGDTRVLNILGDIGASFDLKVKSDQGNQTYDFTTGEFSSSTTLLQDATIDASGVYVVNVVIPAVTVNEKYTFELTPLLSKITTLDSQLVPTPPNVENNEFLITKTISQFKKVTITLTLASAASGSSYNTLPSDVTISGERFTSLTSPVSVTWPVSLSQNAFHISRQPLEIDLRSSVVIGVNGAVTSGATVVLNSVAGLMEGMSVVGTNVNAGARLLTISEETTTIVLSSAVADNGVADGATLTFTYGGTSTSEAISGHAWRAGYLAEDGTNPKFRVLLSDVATKVNGAVNNSKIVNVDSQAGILARSTVFVSGRGIDGSATLPHVDAITYQGVNNRLQLSVAQTLDDNVDLVITGSSQSATITFDYYVDNFGKDDITLTLFLDAIIPVS